jgi:hypothetical protein
VPLINLLVSAWFLGTTYLVRERSREQNASGGGYSTMTRERRRYCAGLLTLQEQFREIARVFDQARRRLLK